MINAEKIALRNDLDRLRKLLNPKYSAIIVLPRVKEGCSFCLKVVMDVPTYVCKKNMSSPNSTNHIEFYIDIYNGYPKIKPRIYYGSETWLYHVNTFWTDEHNQCTDIWDPDNSSLCEIVEKTVRAIVFDDNQKFNSMASTIPEKWQKEMKAKGKLPTMDPALLFVRNIKRTPKAV